MAIHCQLPRLSARTFGRRFLKSCSNRNIVVLNDHQQQTVLTNQCRSASILSRTSPNYSIHRLANNTGARQKRLTKIIPFEFRNFSTRRNLPIIYLFTKEGCTLCDDAVETLKPHMHRFVLEKVDITLPENEKWYDMYKYDIPVFHIYEEFLFKHRVDFDALERGLEKYKDGFDVSK